MIKCLVDNILDISLSQDVSNFPSFWYVLHGVEENLMYCKRTDASNITHAYLIV